MKSYVSMEQHQCFICGTLYETGAILLDKRLRESMESNTVTGTGLCPEHQQLEDDGYVALIVVEDDRKTRTGELCHLKKEIAEQMFNQELTKGIAFIDKELFSKLQEMVGK
jgi:hypothetical protein